MRRTTLLALAILAGSIVPGCGLVPLNSPADFDGSWEMALDTGAVDCIEIFNGRISFWGTCDGTPYGDFLVPPGPGVLDSDGLSVTYYALIDAAGAGLIDDALTLWETPSGVRGTLHEVIFVDTDNFEATYDVTLRPWSP